MNFWGKVSLVVGIIGIIVTLISIIQTTKVEPEPQAPVTVNQIIINGDYVVNNSYELDKN